MSGNLLIEFFVEDDAAFALVLKSDSRPPRMVPLACRSVELLEWSTRALDDLSRGGRLRADQSPLKNLIEMVVEESSPEDLLCFVPHGILHLIPFHALELDDGPLICRNPVSYAPSASVLASVVQRERNDRNADAIVVGDTVGDLPYANDEAKLVSELLGIKPLDGSKTTRAALLERISASDGLRILHLACHGYFDHQDAWSSGIVMADGDSAVLNARDFLERKIGADLIALSACDSGISDQRPGDELVGLTRALLVAGARTVIASLWKVNDLSTSILMRKFYEAWIGGKLSKAQALRCAQRYVMSLTAQEVAGALETNLKPAAERDLSLAPRVADLAGHTKLFSAPRYWAAFTLVGDWI